MSKMMVSEEMKNAPAAPSRCAACCAGKGFYWRSPWRYLSATPWLPVLPQYLEPVGRHLYLYREGDRRPADGDADYRPGNRSVGSLDDGAQLNGDGLLRGSGDGYSAAGGHRLGVGLLCGLFNGLLVTRFNLSSIVITIGTMSLYRGITYILLGDQALNHYPESFAWFGQGYVWGRSLLSLRYLSSSRPPSPSCCIKPTLVAGPTPSAITRPAPGSPGSTLSVITWCCSRWLG